MKYHDTGSKDAAQAPASWLADVLSEDVTELRMQTGYFRVDALGTLINVLKKASVSNLTTNFVIGANGGDTLRSEIVKLFGAMALPRSEARLAVVQFSNALFHPKVYHIKRSDGSQAAFVGSANFTYPGLSGGNVEAALSVDTLHGDREELLVQIAEAIDRWFLEPLVDGVAHIRSLGDIDLLLSAGILSDNRPPRSAASQSTTSGSGTALGRRQKLIKLPHWAEDEQDIEELDGEEVTYVDAEFVEPEVEQDLSLYGSEKHPELAKTNIENVKPASGYLEHRQGFPQYIFFEPGATEPTYGEAALSGIRLPESNLGLIGKLNKDNARHFSVGRGTANISIPVSVINTFRFGILRPSGRPRAEFAVLIRYHSDNVLIMEEAKTNVMAYGFMPSESGHRDLRMLMPAAVKRVASEVTLQGETVPKEGDLFLLEWPSDSADHFGLTFLAAGSGLAQKAEEIYNKALEAKALVGGACMLPTSIAPVW